jgi:exosortase/archaeosortase family protein
VVIDACSGLTFFTMAGFLGYSFGLLLFRPLHKVVAMAILGALLGILTNAARVCLIVGIDWLRGSQMNLDAHQDIQWVVLLVSLGLLLYLASRLDHDDWSTRARDRQPATLEWPIARYAPVLAGFLMFVTVGTVQGLATRTDLSEGGSADLLQQMARRYPDSHWLGSDEADNHALAIPWSRILDVVIIVPQKGTGRLDIAHLRAEDESIWRHTNTELHQDCQDDACISFVHTIWKRKGWEGANHTFYAYYVDDLVTDSRLQYRLARGWGRLSSPSPAVGVIGFKVRGEMPDGFSPVGVFRDMKNRMHATGNGGQIASHSSGTNIGQPAIPN